MIFYIFFLFEFFNSNSSNPKEKEGQIFLSPEMIINETAIGNAEALVDEQDMALPKSRWDVGWRNEGYYPLSAVVDLGSEYLISEISLFDGPGNGTITISTGQPFKWEKSFTYDQSKYNKWEKTRIDKKTRYIQILTNGSVIPAEIRLYGTSIKGNAPSEKKKVATPEAHRVPVDKLIGINAFIDDPIEKIQVASFIREYHNWRWDASSEKYPQNKFAWNPSYAGGGWNFDNFYDTLKKLDIEVIPCVKSNPDWVAGNLEDKPIMNSASSLSPSAYVAHADYLYQYVARYGKAKINDAKLKLEDNQPRVSGLNLISYIENWNEQNKTWEGINSYFTPYEYAAMTSADYDGHQSTMKGNVGIKRADPSIKMVMGGLAGLNIDYVKAIKFWSDHNRDGSVPFDIINLHHYCNSGDVKNPIGTSPEQDNFRERLEKIVAFRDEHMPGKEIWITEFGYDTHPRSPQRVPEISGLSREEVQAQWLVRSYLEIAAAGIDRAAMYMLRDANTESSVKYATSGLTLDRKRNYELKPSWNYIHTLKARLSGMIFQTSKEVNGVRIYKFQHQHNNKVAYVLWSPTAENKKIPNYRLKLAEESNHAVIVNLDNNNKVGTEKKVAINNNMISATISESPIFILIDPK